jgi:hypothetical protein
LQLPGLGVENAYVLQLRKHLTETDHRSVGNPLDLLLRFDDFLQIFFDF